MLHLDLFVEVFDIDPELFIGIYQIVYRTACVQDGCMVFVPAVKSNSCQGSFGMFLSKKHGKLPGLNDFSLPGFGVDHIEREVEIIAHNLLDVID
jgi:hypothetical protein